MWQIVLFVFYFALFSFLIYKWNFFRRTRLNFAFRYGLFLLKVFAAAVVFYVYTYYYSDSIRLKSDIWKYYTDATSIYDLSKQGNTAMFVEVMAGSDYDEATQNYLDENTEFWFKKFNYNLPNENRTIIRIIVLLMFLAGENIYLLTLFSVFLAYLGSTALFLTFAKWFRGREVLLALIIFAIPSVLFWTSALLKEMLVVLFLGLFFYYWIEKRNFIVGIIVWTLLFFTKIYYALPLVPSIVAYELGRKSQKIFSVYSIVFGILIFVVAILHYIGGTFDVLAKLSAKQYDFIQMAKENQAGSYIDIVPLKNDLKNFVVAIPSSLINVLFRPFVWEIKNPLMLINALENIVLEVFLVWLVVKIPRKQLYDLKLLNVFLLLITYVFVVFLIIGYTVPVLGAIVRYRAPALILLFVAIGSLSKASISQKINNWLQTASKKYV